MCCNKNPMKANPLGRWEANNNQNVIDRNIYFANQDHCGSSQYKRELLVKQNQTTIKSFTDAATQK